MVSMTLAVPVELKQKMDCFAEINWSEVARQAFQQKIRDLDFLNEFKAKSTMTEAEAVNFGKKMNKDISKKYTK